MKRKVSKLSKILLLFSMLFILMGKVAYANALPSVSINIDGATNPLEVTSSIQILLIITVLSLAPSIIIMMTSFTRIVVVFYFLRAALGTQQTPPNQALIGLALFMTLFLMMPIFTSIKTTAWDPYKNGQITEEVAFERATDPLKEFMLNQVYEDDLALFANMSDTEPVSDYMELPLTVVIPSFIISELKKGFMIGFLIYIPFIVIDMVVASVLMAMGMMMLPPASISLPFKILLFIMVDGWHLICSELVSSFRMVS
ncbi:MAG: flagellar type III secretion system pore protein FliP [Clostridia bacterium]|nr:flagellar type III secretion system pore protein FliP [Clostridia bacterium]